jgi:hypothetical protein
VKIKIPFVVAVFLLTHVSFYANASSDACPPGFDREKFKDGSLFEVMSPNQPINTPRRFAPTAPEEILLDADSPFAFFYFMKRGEPSTSGAIAIKRIYNLVTQSEFSDDIVISNNINLKKKERKRKFRNYTAYHRAERGQDNRFRQDFHFKYYNSRERSDDEIGKVTSLLFEGSQPSSKSVHKAMIHRYRALRADGTCMRFNLFENTGSNLLNVTRDFTLEIHELDSTGGPAIPRVLLKIAIN